MIINFTFFVSTIQWEDQQCLTAYLRAHKKEPFLGISIGLGVATGLLVWILGSKFGLIGAGASFLIVAIGILPFGLKIWHRCLKEWHKE
jgi:O-antigen/teichoic acid export membrane protein